MNRGLLLPALLCLLMFGGTANTFASRPTGLFGSGATTAAATTATTSAQVLGPDDVVVDGAPDDTVQALKFSPSQSQALLAAGAWDGCARVWSIDGQGKATGQAEQKLNAPILSLCWTGDGTRVFLACADNEVRLWDLASNQVAVCGSHQAPVSTCHWIETPQYSCLMTGSWDKTLRFWDMRQLPTQSSLCNPIQLPERVYSADCMFPMVVVALANRHFKVYKMDNGPTEVKDIESQLKMQSRCVSIFKSPTGMPAGFAVGSIEGRVGIQYVETANPKDNFTFKCHRSPDLVAGYQEIYAVNDIAFHPTYNTLATIGSDGRYSLWDKDARTKLKTSEVHGMPLTKLDIHSSGSLLAYAAGYDWSKGHEGNTQPSGSKIVLHRCSEDMKPKKK